MASKGSLPRPSGLLSHGLKGQVLTPLKESSGKSSFSWLLKSNLCPRLAPPHPKLLSSYSFPFSPPGPQRPSPSLCCHATVAYGVCHVVGSAHCGDRGTLSLFRLLSTGGPCLHPPFHYLSWLPAAVTLPTKENFPDAKSVCHSPIQNPQWLPIDFGKNSQAPGIQGSSSLDPTLPTQLRP